MSPGLYDGFEGHRSATEELRAEAVKSWLVVLDTNVLISLYNYQGQALAEFTDIFKAVGDRLFVPHQVLDEFWRNRRRALSENQGSHRERETVEKSLADAETAFRKWHQRVVDRSATPHPAAVRELAEARKTLLSFMDARNAEAHATTPDSPTHDDHVLSRLEPLLEGRVGPPPTTGEREALIKKGQARITARTPPGYMDADKSPERAVGDFIVWHQTMAEAEQRKMSILMVTNDQKEDRWADRGTASMRARPELASELLTTTGQRLLMMRSRDLIELGSLLGVQVSSSTLTEVALADDEATGWTAELAFAYLEYLYGWPEHYRVFCEAVANDGHIGRARMAEILGRNPEQGMKGAGKPFGTATRRVTEYFELDAEPVLPLAAAYEVGGWMSEFVMPDELLPVFVDAAATFAATE